MVDILALDRVLTMSVAHPYYVSRYKVMVSNINLVNYRNCSDSDVLTYVLVKEYGFCDSTIYMYAHTLIHFMKDLSNTSWYIP